MFSRLGLTNESDDILAGIIDIEPLKPGRFAVNFPQCRSDNVSPVQVTEQNLHAVMKRIVQEMPVKTLSLGPFSPLTELSTHKQELFPGMGPHVSVERPQICELLVV